MVVLNSFTTKKQTTKFSSEIFKTKKVKSKLYHVENSKTREKTVMVQMRWLMMSHLIKIYDVYKISYFVSGSFRVKLTSDLVATAETLYGFASSFSLTNPTDKWLW